MHTFYVAGSGPFPSDMLRYDQCHPCSSSDATAVGLDCSSLRAFESARVVKLNSDSHRAPTAARWASFGWPVVEERQARQARTDLLMAKLTTWAAACTSHG